SSTCTRVSSVFGRKPGKPPLIFPPMPTGIGGSHFRTPRRAVTAAPPPGGAPGGGVGRREPKRRGTRPPGVTAVVPEPGGQNHAPFRVRLGWLEAAGAQELEFRPLRQQAVDFTIRDAVTGLVFALLYDDPPAENADLLDRVGVRDRLDGVHRLDAGQFA